MDSDMSVRRVAERGVTLIELLITLVVLAVLAALATPSFLDFRERRVVTGAADDLVNQIALYRFEAVKLNRIVTVDVRGVGGADWCVGANTGVEACDCSEDACDLGRFPSDASELRGARISGGELGPLRFDPTTGTLTTLEDPGAVTIVSATNRHGYQLSVRVNALGRPSTCVPEGAKSIGGFAPCA